MASGFHSGIAYFNSDIRAPVNAHGHPKGFFKHHAEAKTESQKEEIGEHGQAIIEPPEMIQHIDRRGEQDPLR